MADITKMSSRGQVVIPQAIREALELSEGTQLAIERVGDSVMLKKLDVPSLKAELKRLSGQLRGAAKKMGIRNEQDIVDLVRSFRNETRIAVGAKASRKKRSA